MPALFIGVFMAALDTAVIAPALPALRAAFAIDHREAALLMVVFILCSLSSTALLANLGDRHGRRPVFLGSVACFAAGSLLVALSPSFWMVLVGRAVQGLGAGGITPTASAVIGDAVAAEQRGRALGLIGAIYGMAFVLGPPLATVLMLAFSWHWIFLINLPVAALVLALAAGSLPRKTRAAALPPLDLTGIVLTVCVLGCLVLGITRVADDLLGQRLWPGFVLAAGLGLVLLVRVERQAAAPMIPLSLFAKRQLALTYGLTTAAGFGMGSVVFLSSMAELAHGVEPRHAGFVLLPLVLCSMLGSVGAGRLLNRLRSAHAAARRLWRAGAGLCRFGLARGRAVVLPAGVDAGRPGRGHRRRRRLAFDRHRRGTAGAARCRTGHGQHLHQRGHAAVGGGGRRGGRFQRRRRPRLRHRLPGRGRGDAAGAAGRAGAAPRQWHGAEGRAGGMKPRSA